VIDNLYGGCIPLDVLFLSEVSGKKSEEPTLTDPDFSQLGCDVIPSSRPLPRRMERGGTGNDAIALPFFPHFIDLFNYLF